MILWAVIRVSPGRSVSTLGLFGSDHLQAWRLVAGAAGEGMERARAHLESCIRRWDCGGHSCAVRGRQSPAGQPKTFPFVLRFSLPRPARPVPDHYVTVTAAVTLKADGSYEEQFRGTAPNTILLAKLRGTCKTERLPCR